MARVIKNATLVEDILAGRTGKNAKLDNSKLDESFNIRVDCINGNKYESHFHQRVQGFDIKEFVRSYANRRQVRAYIQEARR